MGRIWNGRCYQDEASALVAFTRDIPSADAAGIITFTAAPTISGTGLITWSISHRPLTGSSATVRNGTTQLLSCTDGSMDQWSVQSLLVVVAILFAGLLGFRTGYRA